MPTCVQINEIMQHPTSVYYHTSDQPKDTSDARQARDVSDTLEILALLKERDPFIERDT